MKFSLQSKSSSKPKPIKPLRGDFEDAGKDRDDGDSKQLQFITKFEASDTPVGSSQAKSIVIPPLQNEWRPYKKMKNLDLPISDKSDVSGTLGFEVESQPNFDGPDSKISYGLNLRQKSDSKEDNERPRSDDPASDPASVPVEKVLLEKLRGDLESLPEHRGMEEFEEVPVEGFGAALLAGYGWKEGRGIGRNAKEDVKVVEYNKRTYKHGLGFRGFEDKDRGEDKAKKRDTERASASAGKQNGHSNEEAREKPRRKEKSKHSNEEEEEKPRKKEEKSKGKKSGQVSWLTSHIRVRIVSKELKGGRLYLKKGKVVDVVGPATCDISMDESSDLIQGVSQDLLETALPRRGGPVLVLYGKHKGVYGNLIRKDLEEETALVQDANNQELLHVRLEQIAEYTGDPSCLGY